MSHEVVEGNGDPAIGESVGRQSVDVCALLLSWLHESSCLS